MPSASEVNAYAAVKRAVVSAGLIELEALMSVVDTSDPQEVYDALTDILPALVAKHGQAMQAIAAEWFEQMVDEPAVLADMVDPSEVEASARWAASASAASTVARPGDVAKRAAAVMDRHLKNEARATLQLSARETPGVAWARVLRGSKNCAFCVTMAGRGADYRSSATAARGGENTKRPKQEYHNDCDCDVIMIRSESDWPTGYDHKELEDMYRAAREKAGVTTLKGGTPGMPRELVPDDDKTILQVMREMHSLS